MVDVGLGTKCNNCCIMCTNVMPPSKSYKEPTTKQIISQLNKLDKKINSILLTGGEPTLRKDLSYILGYINKNFPETRIKLITNARLFYYSYFVKKFRRIRDLYIITELYGPNAKLHDYITQSKGSFNQTFKGIKNLLDNNFKIELRVVISKLNYKDIMDIAELYKKNFTKVEKIVMFPIDIIGNAYKNKKKTFVKYSEIVPFIQKAVDILRSENVELYHTPYCVLNKRYWKFVKGGTVPEGRRVLDSVCKGCQFSQKCPGIWKSYVNIMGVKESKTIKLKE